MMQFAHRPLQKVSGLEFYKLMGTGKAGFNPFPDWSVYAMLQVWKNEEAANSFFSSSSLYSRYCGSSDKSWVLFLKNKVARGEWNGSNPFKRSKTIDANIPLVVALTRATIKTKLLYKFWKYVPKSQTTLSENQGLLYTKGIGEVPFKQMATFSLWKDERALNEFAYQTKGHVSAIGKTRELNWYNEELFARFQPYKALGDWVIYNEALELLKLEKGRRTQRIQLALKRD